MYKKLFAATAVVFAASHASALTNTIDFEAFGLANDPGTGVIDLVGDEFVGDGIATISLNDFISPDCNLYTNTPGNAGGDTCQVDEAIRIVKVGDTGSSNGQDAFVTDDTPAPDSTFFGDYFLTSDFDGDPIGNVAMSLLFSSAVDLEFDIADIDGSGDAEEHFLILGYLNGQLVDTVHTLDFAGTPGAPTTGALVTGDDTGIDAEVVHFSFAGMVDRVEIFADTPTSGRIIGWGLDNITYDTTPIPLPAGVWLLGTALAGMGIARRRRKS